MKQINNSSIKKKKYILSKWGFSWKGIIRNSKGEWYLFSQILIIILHLLDPYPKTDYIATPIYIFFLTIGILISIQGLIIALKAFIDLSDNLTPLTYPMEESILIKTKSYKKTRHPIYKGLLFISLGICIFSLSIIHLLLFLSLAYLLKIKALKEEERLKIKFPEYQIYMMKVPAIIKNINYLDWRS